MSQVVYQAVQGFSEELGQELKQLSINVQEQIGHLYIGDSSEFQPAWAVNVWYNPVELSFGSISQGAQELRNIQRNWAVCSERFHRRALHIQQKLPHVGNKPVSFLGELPATPMGAWTLLDQNTILAASNCSNPFPNGEMNLDENTVDPPSRAYRKLWELFTRTGVYPAPNDLCLDLGSSPGGWTWVLSTLGANVFSVDKSPLHDSIEKLPKVNHCIGSAFGLDPRHAGTIDWVFSDVICYPQRLLTLAKRWLDLGDVKNMVLTIKFQGETDFDAMQEFRSIPESGLVHLHHNKHELTWFKFANPNWYWR